MSKLGRPRSAYARARRSGVPPTTRPTLQPNLPTSGFWQYSRTIFSCTPPQIPTISSSPGCGSAKAFREKKYGAATLAPSASRPKVRREIRVVLMVNQDSGNKTHAARQRRNRAMFPDGRGRYIGRDNNSNAPRWNFDVGFKIISQVDPRYDRAHHREWSAGVAKAKPRPA